MIRNHWKLIVATSATLLGGAAGLAAAKGLHGHDHGHRRAAMLERFDANGDGVLDDAERAKAKAAFAAKRAERVARFDADRDGKLSPAERAAMKEQRVLERFKQLDANGDGVVTLDEFIASRAAAAGRAADGSREAGTRGIGAGRR